MKKNTLKCVYKKGGDCGCNALKPGFNFKPILGGTVDFEPNGMPSNMQPFGNTVGDPQRMMESGRFLNGGRRHRKRRNLGGSKKKKVKKTKRKTRKVNGGGFLDYNPLAGEQNNILSAFGNNSGALLNAKLAAGVPVDPIPKTGLFSSGTKPLV